ncbi:gibberellin 2-beta-dioxygenase 8 [Lactuca sativa]|uniref:gibberellin 2-beta-dioxygenase 8 n=1 Tax=Lactuca sativa TaxID=4236 RepID=UPI000CB7C4FE|nr:gibberellin 2-beta-dioxygenase 8 [Lactuca sativa]
MESSDPPFQEFYKKLFESHARNKNDFMILDVAEERELPMIDLGVEEEKCKMEIAKASQEWGFFQVINHGVSLDVLEKMRCEQVRLFHRPFHEKTKEGSEKFNFLAGSYQWGTPSATCLRQLSWSEAFHVPLAGISTTDDISTLSITTKEVATNISNLAQKIAGILAKQLGHKPNFFERDCSTTSCYLRLNRYPACPISLEVFGLMPHTDSDFLTILHQDQIGGLQLVKDGRWISIKPNPEALIINIGDLFQAWSNNIYKSVEHRVVANKNVERFSTAYFFCPSYETMIQSCFENSVYREFSFGEFREQVQEDVKIHGYKIGLPRFII